MKRKATRRTSIVPLVVLQTACAGIASVTPGCGETESNPADSDVTITTSDTGTTGVGGSIIVLAVNGFGGNVTSFGGPSATVTTSATNFTNSGTSTMTATGTSSTTSTMGGAGGSLIVLAVAGFGGTGSGGDGGDPGAAGEGGAPGASGQGSG